MTTRDAFAGMDIAGYDYGEKRYKKDLKKYPDRLILGSKTFCSNAYKFWELAKPENRLVGDFVRSGFDYLCEGGIGSWEYSDYVPRFDKGSGWISAGAGRIDLTGKLLGEALAIVEVEEDVTRKADSRYGACEAKIHCRDSIETANEPLH